MELATLQAQMLSNTMETDFLIAADNLRRLASQVADQKDTLTNAAWCIDHLRRCADDLEKTEKAIRLLLSLPPSTFPESVDWPSEQEIAAVFDGRGAD